MRLRKLILTWLIAAAALSWNAASQVLPCPSWGRAYLDCEGCAPAQGAGVELSNLRTGGKLNTITARDGSWSLDLSNLPGGFSRDDQLMLNISLEDQVHSQILTAPAPGAECELRAGPALFQIPPLLELQPLENATCQSQLILRGQADGTGSIPKLHLNGVQHVLEALVSSFSIPWKLDYGNNSALLILEDGGGNRVQAQLQILRLYPKDCVPPLSITGRVFRDCLGCQPFEGVSLELTNLRTGEHASTITDSKGSWEYELTHWIYAYQPGDWIRIAVLGIVEMIQLEPNLTPYLEIAIPIPPKLELEYPPGSRSAWARIRIKYHGTGSIPELYLDSQRIPISEMSGILELELELSPGINWFSIKLRDGAGLESRLDFQIKRLIPPQNESELAEALPENLTLNLTGWTEPDLIPAGQSLSLELEDEFWLRLSIFPEIDLIKPRIQIQRIEQIWDQLVPEPELILIAAYNLSLVNITHSSIWLEFSIPWSFLHELELDPDQILAGAYEGRWRMLPSWRLGNDSKRIYYRSRLNTSIIGILALSPAKPWPSPAPRMSPAHPMEPTKIQQPELTPTPSSPLEVPIPLREIALDDRLMIALAAGLILIGILSWIKFRRRS